MHVPSQPPGSATPSPPDPGSVTVRVEDYSLQFKMSGIASLSDFVEDESAARIIPMSVTVQNFLLVLDVSRAVCTAHVSVVSWGRSTM